MSVAKKMKVKNSDGTFRVVNLGSEAKYCYLEDGRTVEELSTEVTGMKASLDELAHLTGNLNKTVAENFQTKITGKIYTTKFPKFSVSTSYAGTKTDDNAGLVCTPSTLTVKGSNDYESIPMFKPVECNWELDSTDGHVVLTAIEGMSSFSRDGSNGQVGVCYMPWYFKTWEDTSYWYVSVTDKEITGYTPLNACIGPDGTNYGFMVYSKYAMGIDSNGYPISASGYYPAAHHSSGSFAHIISYNTLIALCHKISSYYCGLTIADLFFVQLQFMIKFATINSQSIYGGCTSYARQYTCASAGTQPGIIISTSNAANLVVGSTVSIGSNSSSQTDRYYYDVHDLAHSKTIKSITTVSTDTSLSLITLCNADGSDMDDITTTTSSIITTDPWNTGSCDDVLGMDGVCINGSYAVDSIHPYVIGGIEWGFGAYETLGNVVMDITTDSDSNVIRNVYVCHDATALTSTIATIQSSDSWSLSDYTIPGNPAAWKYASECSIDVNNGAMIPTALNATSSTGFCDGVYCDAGTSGQREWLSCGDLSLGSLAGAWLLDADHGLGGAYWSISSRISPNGMANPLTTS